MTLNRIHYAISNTSFRHHLTVKIESFNYGICNMVVSKIRLVEKYVDTLLLVSNIGTDPQEKSRSNAQSTKMRITLRCSRELINRFHKMRKGKAGRVSRNQAIIEILDARVPM